MPTPPHLYQALQKRTADGLLRQVSAGVAGIDFYSNDYLGLAKSGLMRNAILLILTNYPHSAHGATGARLLSGGSGLALEVEAELATIFQAESALLFNSGYAANIGLLQAIVRRQDLVLYDVLCHTSLREGLRLGLGQCYGFRHNDLNHLSDLLSRHSAKGGVVYILVESIYSMDGDQVDLNALVTLAEKHGAYIILDEAHSTGLTTITPSASHFGAGIAASKGLGDRIFARIHTFGKAVGAHGACVVGSEVLTSYLANYSRAFIYTTMMPAHSLAAIRASFQLQNQYPDQFVMPFLDTVNNWTLVVNTADERLIPHLTTNNGPIQTLSTPTNALARSVALYLQSAGFALKPVLSPTVPAGKERIRICLHNYNSAAEMDKLIHYCQIALGL